MELTDILFWITNPNIFNIFTAYAVIYVVFLSYQYYLFDKLYNEYSYSTRVKLYLIITTLFCLVFIILIISYGDMTEWYYALIVTANGIILFFTLNAILKKCIKYYGVITKILAYAGFAVEILLLVILINLDYSKDLDIIKKKQEKNTAEIEHHTFHVNGDLDNTFTGTDSKPIKKQQKSPPTIKLSNEEILRQQKTALYQEGWKDEHINNGNLPNCYNFKPYRSKIDNYLSVYVGSGTDVVIKMMNVETNKCVRFVYINSGSTYKVRNIPEGRYYLKIAYGKEWISKVENGKCVGRFFRAAHYEQGEEIMDFNIKHYKDGRYSIPYFELKLDVVRTNDMNSFESDRISEETFNL